MAEAGRRAEDVYFSSVPSQKSTLSALATITEQLLWLGGPGLGPPRPAASCQPPENAAPPAHNSHPGLQKQAEGAHKSKSCSACLHPLKMVLNYGVFIDAGGSGGGGEGVDF